MASCYGAASTVAEKSVPMNRTGMIQGLTTLQVLLIFAVVYALFLAVSISLVDANTPLDDRILSPLYIIAFVMGDVAVDHLW